MTDRADLIRRLNEAADVEEREADRKEMLDRYYPVKAGQHHRERAALLREAVKALEGGE